LISIISIHEFSATPWDPGLGEEPQLLATLPVLLRAPDIRHENHRKMMDFTDQDGDLIGSITIVFSLEKIAKLL